MTGEAGIGKSTLARVLADEVRAGRGIVVEVRCYEAERSLYVQPLAEAVRELTARPTTPVLGPAEAEALADLTADLTARDPAAPDPGAPSTTAEVGHRRTLLAMAELFGRMSPRGRTALLHGLEELASLREEE